MQVESRKMSKSSKNSKEKSNNNKADAYVCSEDELDLLEVTNECKVSKAAQNIDWESYRTFWIYLWLFLECFAIPSAECLQLSLKEALALDWSGSSTHERRRHLGYVTIWETGADLWHQRFRIVYKSIRLRRPHTRKRKRRFEKYLLWKPFSKVYAFTVRNVCKRVNVNIRVDAL